MMLYAVTIFLSAFLLFQVQPLIAKYILPWFGGTPAVWTTCMLFFQVLLLGGYSYAHMIVSRFKLRTQGWVHIGLLAVALLALPIIPSEAWKPTEGANPTWQILALLTFTVGAPYLLLSSTGPLLQGWFSRTNPGKSPYRLYALSNAGSLLALLSYPFVFERILRLEAQAWMWSIGDVLFAVLCGVCAWQLIRTARVNRALSDTAAEVVFDKAASVSGHTDTERPRIFDMTMWLALPTCGSVMLLATTNQMCQDVAVVPFLWVVPLSLYLLTFIICFEKENWYVRSWFSMALVIGLSAPCAILYRSTALGLSVQVIAYSFSLFACCMSCHGELVRLKPDPRYLTLFYLMVAAGGALGGVLVTLVAPRVFPGFWEYHLGLIACAGLVAIVVGRDTVHSLRRKGDAALPRRERLMIRVTGGFACAGCTALVALLGWHCWLSHSGNVLMTRNFYGVLRVRDTTPATRSDIVAR